MDALSGFRVGRFVLGKCFCQKASFHSNSQFALRQSLERFWGALMLSYSMFEFLLGDHIQCMRPLRFVVDAGM